MILKITPVLVIIIIYLLANNIINQTNQSLSFSLAISCNITVEFAGVQ